jgi:Ca2+-binding RTX toxin-like protein
VAASYIEALLPAPVNTGSGGIRDWRWNNTSPLGTPVDNLTYSFIDSVPAHANSSDGNGFAPFTSEQKTAARSVLDLYEEIARITFLENLDGETGQILFGGNAQGGSAGYAYLPDLFFEADGELGGDVWINKNLASNFDLGPGGHGLATLIHEIGHALGLEHPGNYSGGQAPHLPASTDTTQYTVMSYNDHPRGLWREVTGTGTAFSTTWYNIEPSTLMLYDIGAIQYMYGKNMETRSDDTVYDFETDDPFLMCIWDGGGTDTITVSNFSTNCTINLTAGKFSSISILPDPYPGGTDPYASEIYNGSNNLSIAFGCTIENATGGSANDRLMGNAVKNTLTGNDGNDILSGGAGNDVLDGGSGNDRLIGGSGNDVLIWQASDTRIDGGSGTDILRVFESLDLVAITNQKAILNIETIDMKGGGDSTLTLARNDVLDISSSTNTLKILGDAGDTVDLVGFTMGATKSGFVTWKSGTAILKIEDDITNVV